MLLFIVFVMFCSVLQEQPFALDKDPYSQGYKKCIPFQKSYIVLFITKYLCCRI